MRTLAITLGLGCSLLALLPLGCAGEDDPWDLLPSDARPTDGTSPQEVPEPLPCVTTYSCDAKTADTECGIRSSAGLRAPELGAPYCSDKRSRKKCSCDVLRCQSPAPLCPGTYKVTFRARLVGGCDGVLGQLGGSCQTSWNTVELMPQGMTLAERSLLNTALTWDFADYSQTMTLTGVTPARLVVEQYTWFADVSGAGNAGRIEVQGASISQ